MFKWLRTVFCGKNLPANETKLGEIGTVSQLPLADRTRTAQSQETTLASLSTRVVYARLSPELSRLAIEESVECEISRSNQRTTARPVVSRRRLGRLKRFCRRFEQMSLSDARLLVAVHRGSLRALAVENAGQLHRDIQRFLLSTHGQIAFNGKNTPEIEKIRRWVSEARQINRARVIDPVP